MYRKNALLEKAARPPVSLDNPCFIDEPAGTSRPRIAYAFIFIAYSLLLAECFPRDQNREAMNLMLVVVPAGDEPEVRQLCGVLARLSRCTKDQRYR